MNFINKLNNLIEKGMHYYELQVLVYFTSLYALFISYCTYYVINNPGGGIFYTMGFIAAYFLLYFISFFLLIIYCINKNCLHKFIAESFKFNPIYIKFFQFNLFIGIVLHIYIIITIIFFLTH